MIFLLCCKILGYFLIYIFRSKVFLMGCFIVCVEIIRQLHWTMFCISCMLFLLVSRFLCELILLWVSLERLRKNFNPHWRVSNAIISTKSMYFLFQIIISEKKSLHHHCLIRSMLPQKNKENISSSNPLIVLNKSFCNQIDDCSISYW